MDTEELRQRIKTAIVVLSEGHSLKVGDLTFGCNNKSHFLVSGWTENGRLEKITSQSAKTELDEIKLLFSKMVAASKELSDFIRNREIEYYLGYDYGQGSIEICSEINGELKWGQALGE